jgi:hypothetical protein
MRYIGYSGFESVIEQMPRESTNTYEFVFFWLIRALIQLFYYLGPFFINICIIAIIQHNTNINANFAIIHIGVYSTIFAFFVFSYDKFIKSAFGYNKLILYIILFILIIGGIFFLTTDLSTYVPIVYKIVFPNEYYFDFADVLLILICILVILLPASGSINRTIVMIANKNIIKEIHIGDKKRRNKAVKMLAKKIMFKWQLKDILEIIWATENNIEIKKQLANIIDKIQPHDLG